MKVPSSGRRGFSAKTPPPAIERAIKKAVCTPAQLPPLGPQLAVWAEGLGLTGSIFSGMDDDEIRGLTIELLKPLGFSKKTSVRVLAKINGLQKHRC